MFTFMSERIPVMMPSMPAIFLFRILIRTALRKGPRLQSGRFTALMMFPLSI